VRVRARERAKARRPPASQAEPARGKLPTHDGGKQKTVGTPPLPEQRQKSTQECFEKDADSSVQQTSVPDRPRDVQFASIAEELPEGRPQGHSAAALVYAARAAVISHDGSCSPTLMIRLRLVEAMSVHEHSVFFVPQRARLPDPQQSWTFGVSPGGNQHWRALWQEPEVLSVMQQWWPVVEGSGVIDRRLYAKLGNTLLGKLLPEEDPARLQGLVAEDWQIEARGADAMSFEMFCEVNFKLADLWCLHAPLNEHAAFFHCILQSALHEVQNGGNGLLHFLLLKIVLSTPQILVRLGGLSIIGGAARPSTPFLGAAGGQREGKRAQLEDTSSPAHGGHRGVLEGATRRMASEIMQLHKRAGERAKKATAGADQATLEELQAVLLLSPHESFAWWLGGQEGQTFAKFSDDHTPSGHINTARLAEAVEVFWSPSHHRSDDEAAWLPPGGTTSHAHLNALAVIRTVASLLSLYMCRIAQPNRKGPRGDRQSTREDEEQKSESPMLERKRYGFQGSFQGAVRYDIPPMAASDFQALMRVSGGVVRTKVPPYSRLLEGFAHIPVATLQQGLPALQGRKGASKLLGGLQKMQQQQQAPSPGAAAALSPSKQKVLQCKYELPTYCHIVSRNEHLMGGCIRTEPHQSAASPHQSVASAAPQRVVASPKSSGATIQARKGASISSVTLQREEKRLSDRALLQKVGGLIHQQQHRAPDEYSDGVAVLSHEMESSPLAAVEELRKESTTATQGAKASYCHTKQALRSVSSDPLTRTSVECN